MRNRNLLEEGSATMILALTTPMCGERIYSGRREAIELLAENLAQDPLWGNRPGKNDGKPVREIRTVQLLEETVVRYPLIRWDYCSLDGEYYRLRAENARCLYTYVEDNNMYRRFVTFHMENLCYDNSRAPRRWHPITGDFLGVPNTLSYENGILESRVGMLDGRFASRRDLMADLLCQPPEICLQNAMDEIFSPA